MLKALSIYLPDWPIWLARRRSRRSAKVARPDAAAWLLWSAERGVQRVSHACDQAGIAGVRPGMTLAQARALCSRLPLVYEQPVTPNEDTAALRGLARWMLRHAPVVALDGPVGLMLDIAGCERLFGGERQHVRRIAEALLGWGLHPRLAVAPTFACARALTRYGHSLMSWISPSELCETAARLPACALEVDVRTAQSLADVGIERVGDLLALLRGELAARFGAGLLNRLDRLLGQAPESIEPVQPVRHFMAVQAFDGPISTLEIIQATVRRLLQRLLQELTGLQRGIRELTIELRRVHDTSQQLSIRLTYPSCDEAHLLQLVWPKLERVHLGFGVTDVILRAARTERIKAEQALFLREPAQRAAGQSAALGELVDRLVSRLGSNAVQRVRAAELYLPERAFAYEPVGEVGQGPARSTRKLNPAERPSLLLELPEPVRVMSVVPDGPPIWLDYGGRRCRIVASAGPERITSPWWLPGPELRDYYEVEDEDGRRLWIFRDGRSGQWFVHGRWL